MKKYNFIQKTAVFALSLLTIAACSESIMDDINIDNSHPLNVPAKFIVADLITSTAFQTVGGDFSLYASIYTEQEAGVHNQMYNAEVRTGEPTTATTYNNVWNSTYSNIKMAKVVISKCMEKGSIDENNDITMGIAKVLLAYNGAVLTDLFGDVPFSQAGEVNPDGTPLYYQPKIDKQEDIYKEIFRLLDEAIAHFDGSDAGTSGAIGGKDFIYGGNKNRWKQAAYGLKARYTMHLLAKSSNRSKDLQDIISFVDKSFTSAGSALKFAKYDGDEQLNPLFGFSYSRDALGASQSLLNKFTALNDPRLEQFFASWDTEEIISDPDEIFAAPNGSPIQSQGYYSWALADYSLAAPTQLLSYHELLFLKAEALARLGNANAENVLKEAVTAAFANLEEALNWALAFGFGGEVDLNSDIADEYFSTEVEPRFAANPVKEVMIQKYLAFAGASGESIETYNDCRRLKALKEDFIVLENPLNANKFPHRFAYGIDDVTNNAAVKAAYGDGSYVYSEPVWWAGGTR